MKFNAALKTKDFVVTAQPKLDAAPDAASLMQQAEILRPVVDGLQLTDKSSQHLQMSGLAAAAILIPQGIDPIMQFSCRDRNRIAMDKDLVGAAAIGVNSILVKRGKRLTDTQQANARNVYDIGPIKFASYVQSLKDAKDSVLGPDFMVGANANLHRPGPNWSSEKLQSKCDAGVNFFQSPVCFDMDLIRSFMARAVEQKLTHRTKFIMAVSPLPSADIARWMRDNVSSAHMPEELVLRMQNAADEEAEGVQICAELLQALADIPGVSGVNLLTLGRLETIPAAIAASGIREESP